MRQFRIAVVVIAAVLWSSCGSGGSPDSHDSSDTTRSSAAAWSILEANPGVAGTDYDPDRIMVVYREDAQLPAGFAAQPRPGVGPAYNAASRSNASLREHKGYEPLTDALAQRYGLEIRQQVYLGDIRIASFELPAGIDGAALLTQLRSEAAAFVEHAMFSRLKHARALPNDPEFLDGPDGPLWCMWQIGCPEAWDVTYGAPSAIVAVVDTGVRITHEELAVTTINPEVEFPWADCNIFSPTSRAVTDYDGHGTFIAGKIAAQGNNSLRIVGAAPHCRVLPIKIADELAAYVEDLIAGALLASQLGAQVINYSWGGYDNVPAEEAMVNQIAAAGKLFVCAAGNDGTTDNDYPAAFSATLSVGSTNKSDGRSSFSNYGSYVDVAAPGQQLKSCSHVGNSNYDFGEGTSYAAPLVAAAAGLLWSHRPELTLDEVRQALVSHGPVASGFTGTVRRLDIGAAMESVRIHVYPSAGINLAQRQVIGTVAGASNLTVMLQSPLNVAQATYTLDLAPFGTDDGEDIIVPTAGGGVSTAQIPLAALRNQQTRLLVEMRSSTNDSATITVEPLWVFNQRGDVNGDGLVDADDLMSLEALIGLESFDPGFVGFADSDRDGRITELDAAAVGYSFGAGQN